MATMQTINTVKDYAATSSLATSTTKTSKIIKQALGLACPCDVTANYQEQQNPSLQGRRRKPLRIPASPELPMSYNPLETIYAAAAAAATNNGY